MSFIPPFDFEALPDDEKIALRIIHHAMRMAKLAGKKWDAIHPQIGASYDGTIFLTDIVCAAQSSPLFSNPSPSAISSPVERLSSPAPSPAHGTNETTREVPEEAIPQNRLPADLADCCSCREALMVMFHIEQHRMSAGEARQWLADHGKQYKEKTVETVLTQLRTDGQLNNIKDGHGKGFGLAEWQ